MVIIDEIDSKILLSLLKDSRQTIKDLAIGVGKAREVVTYRVNRLEKLGVIQSYYSDIDAERLDYIAAAIFFSVSAEIDGLFREYLKERKDVSWSASWSGIWSYGCSLYGKNIIDIDRKFGEFFNKFRKGIINYRFSFHKETHFCYEKFFSDKGSKLKQDKVVTTKSLALKDIKLDKANLMILAELSKNSRISALELSKKLGLTAPAVLSRLESLEKSKIIKSHTIFIAWHLLGYGHYSVFVENNDIYELSNFINYLKNEDKVSFVATYVGNSLIEFGVLVKDQYELGEVLAKVKTKYPQNTIFEVSLMENEFISLGAPSVVFE